MTAERRARLLVAGAALAVFAIAVAVGRPQGGARGGDTPTDMIYDRLVPAMRAGDVGAYLDCFGEPLRGRLQAAVDEQGRAAFADGLRSHMRAVTGIAVSKQEVLDADAALRLEWVYREDSDVQQVRLRRENGRWIIVDMSGSRRGQLPVPYGTEVVPGLRPEGDGQ